MTSAGARVSPTPTPTASRSRPPRAAPTPAGGGGAGSWVKDALRMAGGFEAQEAMLAPPDAKGPVKVGAKAPGPAAAADDRQREGADVKAPPLPQDFTQEAVLREWIAKYNVSLMKSANRGKLIALRARGWAGEAGLDFDLLMAAAARWQPPPPKPPKAKKPPKSKKPPAERGATENKDEALAAAKAAPAADVGPGTEGAGAGGGAGAAPPEATIAKVFAMITGTRDGYALHGVVQKDYPSQCLQFSDQLLRQAGGQRASGQSSGLETGDATAAKGPLASYRMKHVKELPATLPPGYQIGVTSMPEWGFTHVGNHWFLSAGGGYYVDNTVGIATGALMTQNLVGTTGDQWADRVMNPDSSSKALAAKLVAKFPELAQYVGKGQAKAKKPKKGEDTAPAPAEPTGDAQAFAKAGKAAIKALVKKNEELHPRIWVVEPTVKGAAPEKAADDQKG